MSEMKGSRVSLLERLRGYAASDYHPFHMPGHKRQPMDLFSIDITEIEGFDDLHHAKGILKDSMEWAARCYGSDLSDYLVNGSSGGILSAVSGCVSRKGKILISRNCHKSVYNGILLNGLEAEYVYPQIMEGLGIQGGIAAEDVEKKLIVHPDIQAVMIVSPTYDGIVSDIERIAEVVHRYGIPLIVDEAHGAHFSFARGGYFPVSALDKGADVVIQSLHKTLPCLTQTAIIHLKKKYLGQEKIEKIKEYLSIYQSSSPSYLFLAAIEDCLLYMDQKGREELARYPKRLEAARERCRDLKSIYVPGREWVGKAGIYDMDLSKIVMFAGFGKKNGIWLDDHLRRCHHLELEMKGVQYALALTSFCDREEGLDRLVEGLKCADQVMWPEMNREEEIDQDIFQEQIIPKAACTIQEAKERKWEERRLKECEGRIAADLIYLYPPGIPCLAPGEIISDQLIVRLDRYKKMGLSVQGIKEREDVQMIRILK